MPTPSSPPIIWSIAGVDSGGGAGHSADQRAADAMGVHLCPVVAAITAQNTQAVCLVQAVDPTLLEAQLQSLADDLAPRVIKTGLIGSAANARVVARWVDKLRERAPVQLVIDPVLRASTGASLADSELLHAYREWLLPRADVITPNQHEARALLGDAQWGTSSVPDLAQALRSKGISSVCITGGDANDALANDWLATPHAQAWLSLPRESIDHNHGTGCTFATAMSAALALGFVSADAAVLAKMVTTHALRGARAVGQGAGPVIASSAFSNDPSLLPRLSLNSPPPQDWTVRERASSPGVYAIADSAERVEAILSAPHSVGTVQLRMKRPHEMSDETWKHLLRQSIARSQSAADAAGATLVINDHWQLALEAGAKALHLGQEDLLALSEQEHAQLQLARGQGVSLGLSSHSLWELCRAAGQLPDYIACGPVWPTTTKDMPWHPQGLDNLAWWAQMSPAPVVGIGGVLEPEQLQAVAAAGAAGGCVVRGLGAKPSETLPMWLTAWRKGLATHQKSAAFLGLPHPSL